MMETEKVKCLIVGSGPAGYTAAIYAGRANLSPVLYAGLQPGGQLTTTTDVENFPGYPQGIGGPELMEDLRKQAERFGADLRYGVATAANLAEAPYKITIDDEKMIEAETLIIATGAAAKYLGLEDEEERLNALHHIIRQHLNVAQTEQYIDKRLAQLQTTPPSGRRVFLLKDVRLFLNSLDRGLRLVREAGIGAESRREDTEDAILLTIRIPKNRRVG